MRTNRFSRRTLLRNLASGGLGSLFLPNGPVFCEPQLDLKTNRSTNGVVRVRGIVRSHGKPVKGVPVSDGLSVVLTDPAGEFEIVSNRAARFVFITLPSEFKIPLGPQGKASFFRAITPASSGEMSAEFELSPLTENQENHFFCLLADPQMQTPEEVETFRAQTLPDMEKTHQQVGKSAFSITCGDMMFDNLWLLPQYENAIRQAGLPSFHVVGNHDLNQSARISSGATQTFRYFFGPEYYSFNRGSVHYVILNDVFWFGRDYVGYLTEEQLQWLDADLSLVEPGRTVVVALHIPALSTHYKRAGSSEIPHRGSITNRELLFRLLEPFNAHILSGHTHETEHVFHGRIHEHIHGAACGAWWTGPICFDGTPNGYGIYQVLGEEIRWAYKSTGKDLVHQMRLYPRGADPAAPDEIVANVWNWDPDWKVFWYEDGQRRDHMTQRIGFDPLSMKLHKGRLPEKHPWVEPRETQHLFYARASKDAREIRVEAIDRFGNQFTETLAQTVDAESSAGVQQAEQ